MSTSKNVLLTEPGKSLEITINMYCFRT
jgi:hypothetical protein